jgi:multiple sugar transport system permease protein
MPIIARVGRKRFSVRLLLAGMYCALIAGGLSMLYPFLLMLATSTTGEPDSREFRIIPRFWYSDAALYQRFIQEKYQNITGYTETHADPALRWMDIEKPPMTLDQAKELAEPWHAFLATLKPDEYTLWYVGRRSMPGKTEMLWRDHLRAVYKTPEAASAALGKPVNAFTEFFAPYEQPEGRLWPGVAGVEGREWDAFKSSLDPKFRKPVDGTSLWQLYLRFKHESVAELNASTGEKFAAYADVALPARLPASGLAKDWEHWVREELGYRFIGIDDGDALYRNHLLSEGRTLEQVNAQLGTHYATPASITWPPEKPSPAELDVISAFIRNVPATAALSVRTPDIRYAEQVATTSARDAKIRPPYAAEDVVTFSTDAGQWRRWAFTRNFAEVVDYVAVRGRSLWNTLFLVSAMVVAAITVNPLAAYALSRFRLSLSNQVLIFLLATMAFPGEVTMIPNFLLLREFPVWSWIIALLVGSAIVWSIVREDGSFVRWALGILLGLSGGIFAGIYVTPLIGHAVGVNLGPISLLNTFSALILPRLANGYAIFLLKGFFDSLPEEIFEAGRIDGASELRMLWQVAFPLSTPILAVVVLQTFTAAYGSYLWALVVCQDDSMWTLMVHMFQLQQWAPSYVTMAAAVLCSIPTLLIFVLAQNMIMRGVVIPVYK